MTPEQNTALMLAKLEAAFPAAEAYMHMPTHAKARAVCNLILNAKALYQQVRGGKATQEKIFE